MKKRNIVFEKGPIGWLQRYALLSYDHPLLLFFCILGVIVFFGALGGLLGFELSETGGEWDIKSNEDVKRDAAIEEALTQLSQETDQAFYSIAPDELQIFITYEAKKGVPNVFTKENLETQKRVENEIMSGRYKEVCLRDYDSASTTDSGGVPCAMPLSVLHYFYQYHDNNATFGGYHPGSNERNFIVNGLDIMNTDLFNASFFLDKSEQDDDRTESSRYTRSRFELGLPINFAEFEEGIKKAEKGEEVTNYTSSKTDEDDQIDEMFDEFLDDLEQRLFDLLGMEPPTPLQTEYSDFGELDNLEVLWYNPELADRETSRVVMADFMWAGLSILSVWVYMLIHLGSVFLSLIGIVEIFMSFPVALFFYKPLFQIDFFNEMNLLVIFILLGIGADDIFVFTDAYKQSGSVPGIDPSLQGRLMYSASRASKAVFVTSFTTMAAFFATAVSPLMPMQAFGIFAALCIVFLFLINLFLMPPTLVIYAGYTPYMTKWVCPCCIPDRRPSWVNTYFPCCTCCHVEIDETFFLPLTEGGAAGHHQKPGQPSPPATTPTNVPDPEVEMSQAAPHQEQGSSYTPPQDTTGQTTPPNERPIILRRQSSLADAGIHELRSIEKFFYGPFFLFLQRAKYVILLIGLTFFCLGIGFITTFKTPDGAESWYPEDHALNQVLDYFDPDKTPFRDSFQDNVAEVYLAWGLKGMDTSNIDRWDSEDYGKLQYDTDFDLRPKEAQEFLLDVCKQVRQAECSASACIPKYLINIDHDNLDEDPLQQKCWIEDFDEWLKTNGSEGIPLDPSDVYERIRDYLAIEAKSVLYGEQIGYSAKDGDVRFVFFRFDSTFRPPGSSSKAKKVMDEWEEFMDGLNSQAADRNATTVSRGFQSGREAWLWPSISDALISGAISGLLLVFVLAFVVLNVASGNVMISIIAVMTIAGIVATVMGVGIRAMMGWDLGTAESITIVILIGFSMDYTLHLSDAYMESPHSNRADRTRDAMTHLGISVTAGALTTLISGLFLWATILVFFQKFAFNITATVLTSFLFSIFVFPSLCLTIGPQGEFGNWTAMYRALRQKKPAWEDTAPQTA